jgi:hypothetical protein
LEEFRATQLKANTFARPQDPQIERLIVFPLIGRVLRTTRHPYESVSGERRQADDEDLSW